MLRNSDRYPSFATFLFMTAVSAMVLSSPPAYAQACPDADGDTYADCTVPGCDDSMVTCGDCNDADVNVNPGIVEVCNQIDDDCNGISDEGFAQPLTTQVVQDTVFGRPFDSFGYSVAGIGDVTSDGVEDFVVGIPQDDAGASNAGSVLLYSGADRSIVCRAVGPAPGNSDYLGHSVAAVPDMTSDGVGDFLSGARYDDDAGSNAGSVMLFSGADCSFVRIYLDPGAGSNDELGYSVSWLEDITGDGVPEVVAGVWRDDDAMLGVDSGSVVVFNGANAAVVYKATDPGGSTSDWLGVAVANVGDIDGDTTDDIAVGSMLDDDLGNDSGSVVLFSGIDGSLIRKMTSGSAGDQLGTSVLALGDVDGDTIPDIAAGAPNEDLAANNHGAVVVFSGVDGAVLRLLTDPLFPAANISLGSSLASMGDLNGDGISEVLAGAYQADVNGTNSGSAFIFDPTDGTEFRGELLDPAGAASDQLGFAVGAADVTGDGMREALLGAYQAESAEETDVGKVVIFSYESDCDGDGQSPFGGDCDDIDADNYTGNTETCDAQDNDCDAAVDEDDDGDGFGVCDGDCDEANPLIYPGAPERCNGVDDDCNGVADNGADLDGDGAVTPCDCDDSDDTVFPGATEVCNHVDDNCGEVDEGFVQPLTAQTVQDTAFGRPFDNFGYSVAGIGDVTSDGVEDFVVGIPLDDAGASNAGSVLLYSGADRSIVCRAVGPAPGSSDYLGHSVAAVPDMTGDGVGDFLSGVRYDDDAGSNAGSVMLFSGADCSFVRIYLDPGAGSNDELGYSVSWLEDITGDGVPEVLAGVRYDDTSLGVDTGSVVVFNGANAFPVYRLTDPDGRQSDWLGNSVAGIGDVNFDGVADIAAGAVFDDNLLGSDVGSVAVFSGADGSLIRKMTTGSTSDYLGTSVLALDDVDGDGVRDIAAGAPNEDLAANNHGAVVVFSGRDGSVLRKMVDPLFAATSTSLGSSLASMGDLNGDGISEVLVGAYQADVNGTNSGSAFIFDPTDGSQFRGDELLDPAGAASDQLGFAVGAADVTGDGMREALVGAYQAESAEETDVGKVVIFSYESDCDGDGQSPFGDDCDDIDADNYTGNTETCDSQDNDCDAAVDEDDDGDGFGVCDGDCDEANPLIYPGAPERCNGVDDDCDTVVDNGPDADGDMETAPCDCDDSDAAVNSTATETCDRRDEDCDGTIDEGFTGTPFTMKLTDTQGAAFDSFGYTVAGIGDGDGDGAVDFVVGIPQYGGNNAGSVLLYSGHDRSELCRAVNPAPNSTDWLGASVAGVGDINGDGRPDFAAGARYDDDAASNAGSVLVFSGADCSFIRLYLDPDAAAQDELGTSVSGLPDVTGDGVPEILAGARLDDTPLGFDAGSALVFNGATGAVVYKLTDPDGRQSDWFGASVAGIGDVNFDGVTDIAVGAVFDDNLLGSDVGSVIVFSGADGSLIRKMTAGSTSDYLATSLVALDDVDGDGVADIAAGAPNEDVEANNAGAVVIFSGRDGSVIRLLTDPFGSSGDLLGQSLAAIPDVSGDGIGDVVAGAFQSDVNGSNSGSAFVLDTATGFPVAGIAELTDPDGAAGDRFGFAVASVGDIRNGGVPEIVVASSEDDDAVLGGDAGSLTLFSFDQYDCDGDGFGPLDGDCGDTNSSVPGPEVCDGVDNDCDLLIDDGFDTDDDGFTTCASPTPDCDDTNATVFPGAPELCDGLDTDCDTVVPADETDADMDTYPICAGDCNDGDAAINPGAMEGVGDGVDQNCDGDELCYEDLDTDTFGTTNTVASVADLSCMDAGEAVNSTDCDDGDATVNPGAVEGVADGVDQDCDSDELCFEDLDGDTYGTSNTVTSAGDLSCLDAGEAVNDTDCNDGDATVNPAAVEGVADGVDQDCDSDELCFEDLDGDTYGTSNTVTSAGDLSCLDAGEAVNDTDCNDGDAAINPGAMEGVGDEVDQDCDGSEVCYEDMDGDTYGSSTTTPSVDTDCSDVGESVNDTDCNDADININPGAMEVVGDEVDQDCDGGELCWLDADNDTYGDDAGISQASADVDCADAMESTSADDCDDTDPAINPGAVENPGNGIDENCDGADGVQCFTDNDGDGEGTLPMFLSLDPDCLDPGESPNDLDCDDTNASINTMGTEIADNGIDEDCNGFDTVTCFVDGDRDGFGSTATTLADDGSCDTVEFESANDQDCDDADNTIFPGAVEGIADGVDQDCSGDELCYDDQDGDGFGTGMTTVSADLDCADPGESGVSTDCDDTNGAVNPGATEVAANGVDDDCDSQELCYVDADADGFGSNATVASANLVCSDAGEADNSSDCDDTDPAINPVAAEIPGNGVDENCDGSDGVQCFTDNDGDGEGTLPMFLSLDPDCLDPGESPNDLDCDDTDAAINTGAAEIVDDGVDQDCNGSDAITCFVDGDQDGFGSMATTVAPDGSCDTADSESSNMTDCDDTQASINPGAVEVPDDGVDQDCSGADTVTCFVDGDQDGYGTAATTLAPDGTCDAAQGESAVDTDCDDGDAAINPGAAEICNDGIDNNCDGVIDLADVVTCGGSITECSTLGDQPAGQDVDDDIYMITGVQGEQVDITLDVQSGGAGRATLMVVDLVMGQTTLFEIDTSVLPNDLSVQLPADGDYRIAVIEQPALQIGPGPIFTGDYCLTVDSSLGAAATLSQTSTVEPFVFGGSARPEGATDRTRPQQGEDPTRTKSGRGAGARRQSR